MFPIGLLDYRLSEDDRVSPKYVTVNKEVYYYVYRVCKCLFYKWEFFLVFRLWIYLLIDLQMIVWLTQQMTQNLDSFPPISRRKHFAKRF
jgi:hypothetical protein